MSNQPENDTPETQVAEIAKVVDLSLVTRTKSVFNKEQVQKLFSPTPKKYLYQRPAKGGGEWTYAKIGYVRKALDGLFGFNWDFDIETTLSEAFDVAQKTKVCVVKGRITGRVFVDGQWTTLSKTQFGRAEVKFKKNSQEPLDFGNDMKAASTDALKKCAALFGIVADVYEKDDYEDMIIEGSERDQREKSKKKTLTDEEFTMFLGGSDEFIKRHKDTYAFTEKQLNLLAEKFNEPT